VGGKAAEVEQDRKRADFAAYLAEWDERQARIDRNEGTAEDYAWIGKQVAETVELAQKTKPALDLEAEDENSP
jgi:hypothetical protein